MKTDQEKYDYLKKQFGLDFSKGIHSFKLNCHFCRQEIRGRVIISENGRAYNFTVGGASLNPDLENIRVLCRKCRSKLMTWGTIQRWLKSVNRTEKDLPNCSNLPTPFRGY